MGWANAGGWSGRGWGKAAGGGSTPVVHEATDSTPTFCNNAVPSNSTAITVPTVSNGLLLVGVAWDGGSLVSSTAVSWNAVAMTKVGSALSSDNGILVELWGLLNPAAGTNTLAFTWNSATTRAMFCGSTWSNVNQSGGTSTYGTAVTNTGTGTGSTVSITGTTNDFLAAIHGFNGGSSQAVGQTSICAYDGPQSSFGMNRTAGTGSSAALTASVAFSAAWASVAVALKPV